ncbi:hypothetical protein Tco_0242081, partial [Tanacetum coccineum]
QDVADEETVPAHAVAGSPAEAHPVPHPPPFSPVREPTPERLPETEWVVPIPVSPITDWRPWPSVPAPIRETMSSALPAGYVDPDTIDPIIFGPPPRPYDFVDPALEDISNLNSMEDDTILGGFHEETHAGPDDAPTPTADAAGRAEDPALLTSLSAKIDRCMGRIDSLETELGTSKKIMGGAILTLDDVDLEGLSRMASEALGHDQPAVPSEHMEEREEEEVPLRRKAPMPELDIPAEFLVEDAQARQRLAEEQASERLVQRNRLVEFDDASGVSFNPAGLATPMTGSAVPDTAGGTLGTTNPALARELLGADVNEDNFIERMTAIKERKKRALADLRYRALQGKPLKQSEVTKMMRNLVKNQWCAAHNGTITMKAVTAMSKQQLTAEYEIICRRTEKDRLLSAQYNLFRPKPAITEPPSKRQRVERTSSRPSVIPAATTQPADDPDSAGGSSFHHLPIFPLHAQWILLASQHELEYHQLWILTIVLPRTVSTDHEPIDVLLNPTPGGINAFFLDSDVGGSGRRQGCQVLTHFFSSVLPLLHLGLLVNIAGCEVILKTAPCGIDSVDDFLCSESEMMNDIEEYIPLFRGTFKDWEIVRCRFVTLPISVLSGKSTAQELLLLTRDVGLIFGENVKPVVSVPSYLMMWTNYIGDIKMNGCEWMEVLLIRSRAPLLEKGCYATGTQFHTLILSGICGAGSVIQTIQMACGNPMSVLASASYVKHIQIVDACNGLLQNSYGIQLTNFQVDGEHNLGSCCLEMLAVSFILLFIENSADFF